MGLIINQGSHDPKSADGFQPIVSPKELAQIVALEESKFHDDSINVKFEIIGESEFAGRTFFDTVSYDPNSNMAWKYVQLRARCGVPYLEGEPSDIDIEALLLEKVVVVELSKTPKKDEPNEFWQRVKYLKTAIPGSFAKDNDSDDFYEPDPITSAKSNPGKTENISTTPDNNPDTRKTLKPRPTTESKPADIELDDDLPW